MNQQEQDPILTILDKLIEMTKSKDCDIELLNSMTKATLEEIKTKL